MKSCVICFHCKKTMQGKNDCQMISRRQHNSKTLAFICIAYHILGNHHVTDGSMTCFVSNSTTTSTTDSHVTLAVCPETCCCYKAQCCPCSSLEPRGQTRVPCHHSTATPVTSLQRAKGLASKDFPLYQECLDQSVDAVDARPELDSTNGRTATEGVPEQPMVLMRKRRVRVSGGGGDLPEEGQIALGCIGGFFFLFIVLSVCCSCCKYCNKDTVRVDNTQMPEPVVQVTEPDSGQDQEPVFVILRYQTNLGEVTTVARLSDLRRESLKSISSSSSASGYEKSLD